MSTYSVQSSSPRAIPSAPVGSWGEQASRREIMQADAVGGQISQYLDQLQSSSTVGSATAAPGTSGLFQPQNVSASNISQQAKMPSGAISSGVNDQLMTAYLTSVQTLLSQGDVVMANQLMSQLIVALNPSAS
ncbi:MAG: hypothetical protein SFZ03_07280 [Candidatus Melainabacteria bacterium]|nr:hypothetical protein [Candidatus Melainabacteria bacterium]